MFVLSIKMKKNSLILYGIILIICIVIGFLFFKSSKDIDKSDRIDSNIQQVINVKHISADDNIQRIEFLKSFGWKVSDEPIETADITIPKELDDVFNRYNEIQKQQGFNLEKYLGKKIKRYTYKVLNYPNNSENIRANIFVLGKKIIAGDICSVAIDGFMHGFEKQN